MKGISTVLSSTLVYKLERVTMVTIKKYNLRIFRLDTFIPAITCTVHIVDNNKSDLIIYYELEGLQSSNVFVFD